MGKCEMNLAWRTFAQQGINVAGGLGSLAFSGPEARGVLPCTAPDVVNSQRNADMNWQVYIILCSDDSLYTGITTDVERRFAQHLAGTGAKYFRGRSPLRLVYWEGGHDRRSASRREIHIKQLSKVSKLGLIASNDNHLEKLSDH